MTSSSNIIEDIQKKIEENNFNLDFFRDQILIADSEKEQYDNAIQKLDNKILLKIEEVNQTLCNVKEAYQARFNAGCRTDLFWRVVGFTTGSLLLNTLNTFTLKCTRLTLQNYEVINFGIVGLGDTSYGNILSYYDGSQIINYPIKNLLGWIDYNFHGIKYYDEPITKDIGDTTVASFTGKIQSSTNNLIVMSPFTDGIGDLFKVNQLVVSNKEGIFPQESNKIVGIETALQDLSDVYSGIGVTVVNVLILDDNALLDASIPESDGSFVSFTVLDDPIGISTISEYSIPFESNPFSPQTIGIMYYPNIGIGRTIVYDNSGNNSNTQSWKPENAIQGIEDVPDVVEPIVGAGKLYYKVGFNQQPRNPLTNLPAFEGQVITLSNFSGLYGSLPLCSTEENNLSIAISARNSKEYQFLNEEFEEFNSLLQASSYLRTERDNYNSKIWGLRQSIGGEIEEIERYQKMIDLTKTSIVSDTIVKDEVQSYYDGKCRTTLD